MHNVACIVLAAGGGTRFGSVKQLQLVSGRSLVSHAVGAALHCGAQDVVVVTGARASDVEGELKEFSSVSIVKNEDWQSGIASSICAGVRALEEHHDIDGIMITLGDQPLVDQSCLRRLLAKFDRDNRIVASRYNDTIGVPAIIGIEYADDLVELKGDRGAGGWLRARIDSVVAVDMPEAALDIDTPGDLERD